MKNLIDIIIDCKEGREPEYDELLYSVIALSALMFFADQDVQRLTDEKCSPIMKQFIAKEHPNRRAKAYNKSPKEWVGWNNDPKNPNYLACLKTEEKILDNIIKKIDAQKSKENT